MNLAERLESQYAASRGDDGVELQDLEGDIELVKRLLKTNAEFFIEFFLAEQLDMPVPQFHKEIWGLATDQEKERILLAVPRDHAKTTIAKLAVIWYWLFTPHRFTAYLSNTSPIAKGACRDIIEWLSHPNFVKIYGRVKFIKQSDNEGLWTFDLTVKPGRVKRCTLRALGQGQQMRGINIDNRRPDLAIVDDVEDNDNTSSDSQQKKLDTWMFGPFLKALARKKKILWLGNMLTKTSLLARLSRNPRWNPVVFGSLIKDAVTGQLKPLWPDKWTVEELREDFLEYKSMALVESWMCEMMNMPGHGENGFTADQLFYAVAPTPDTIQAAFLTIDPAFGVNAHNDETAITVHLIPEGGVPVSLTPVHGHFSDVQMFYEALTLAQYWNAWAWGVEAVAAQRVLITLFDMLAAINGIPGRVSCAPLMSGRGDPKIGRIKAFVALIEAQEWAIEEYDIDLTNQLLELDFKKKEQPDDLCDSAAYGPMMYEEFEGLITHAFNAANIESHEAEYGMEVANV